MYDDSSVKTKELEEQANQITPAIMKIRKEILDVDSELETIKLNLNSLDYQNRGYNGILARLKNERNCQMEFLKQRFRPTYDAVCWLEQNKSSFKSEIYFPPLLSVKVFKDEDRKYIENIVSLRDFRIFVCTNEDDVKRLTDILYNQMNLRVNIALAPREGISAFRTPSITPALRKLGVERFASELFTAPDPVMSYLCAVSRMNKIPICNETSLNCTEQILHTYSTFYTPSERIAGLRSRYGARNLTIRKDAIRAKNLIQSATTTNAEQLQELEKSISEGHKKIENLNALARNCQNKRSSLEKNQEELNQEKAKINEIYKKHRNIGIQLREKIGKFERTKSDVINEAEEKKIVISKICSLNNQRLSEGKAMSSFGLEFAKLKMQNAKDLQYIKILCSKLSNLKSTVEKKRYSFEDFKMKLDVKESEYSEIIRKGREMSAVLMDNHDGLKKNMDGKNSLQELEKKIINIQAQIDLNYEDNAAVVEQFYNRQQAILKIDENIENVQKKCRCLISEMKQKKQQFLPPLEYHIKNINQKFSNYYKLLKCAGEISLEMGNDPDDFSEYGLQMRLKYRDNEPFSILSPDHHSGGERNVASVIFILSLQDLTTVPFRCVDEINQGMDNSNERKMYEFIAADASKTDSCSQYFLLTPKLLPNLVYHKDVAVHVIFNSRFLETRLNIEQHLQIAGAN